MYDNVIYNELYHSHPEVIFGMSGIRYYFDTTLDIKLSAGHFIDRYAQDDRYLVNLSLTKNLYDKHSFSFSNQIVSKYQSYSDNVDWSRFYTKFMLDFPLFGVENEVSYLKMVSSDGYSPFIFDTLNEITDDEISLISMLRLYPLKLGFNLDYRINESEFRNLKYSIGLTIHCWELILNVDQKWDEISFDFSIPNLN